MSVIEDRHKGFLQAVLVAPASRTALVLGKTLGGVAIALVQAALFLALAPLAGFDCARDRLAAAGGVLLLASASASPSLGFAIAWWLDSTQGYHVVMSVLLIPLWILSGAMFPPRARTGGARADDVNPMAYAVAGVRRALYGGALPGGLSRSSSAALEIRGDRAVRGDRCRRRRRAVQAPRVARRPVEGDVAGEQAGGARAVEEHAGRLARVGRERQRVGVRVKVEVMIQKRWI